MARLANRTDHLCHGDTLIPKGMCQPYDKQSLKTCKGSYLKGPMGMPKPFRMTISIM